MHLFLFLWVILVIFVQTNQRLMKLTKQQKKKIKTEWWKVHKLKERLIIICDHNVRAGIDISEEDSLLLSDVCKMLDTSKVMWTQVEASEEQSVTQSDAFSDKKTDKP